ncbi:protein phosphatase 2c [Stylonychia lemnae]|uniref:Protein phosphatase 2c n=1 Tax=Stylonychia lemnae TaxID=5949 RepID=A0A078BF92_STYLE|nr:protein phosphatase 2c [Stylonychia lemnae]|eukprot:CDW91807.1 protein phosphatase 2c [Stylonychia lemnae]
MGPYLTQPRKDKDNQDGENSRFKFGATGMQGWRNTMEDSHIAQLDIGNGIGFFGVYDGHGGNEVAEFVRDHLVDEFKKLSSFKAGNYEEALKDIYIHIDEMLQTTYGKQKLQSYKKNSDSGPSLFGRGGDDIAQGTGCTATSALITPNEIIVANSGDSRIVLAVKKGDKYQAIEMSEDHKPDNKGEKARIERAGGFVEENRVKGVLNLSRSLGDLEYKLDSKLSAADQMITAVPEIRKEKISSDTAFLVIACDGIWDCLTSQESVELFGELLPKKPKISDAVNEVFDKIIASDVASSGGIGCDNMTCVVVQFKPQ